MSFSRSQQGIYRPIVQRAWGVHANANAINSHDKKARESWYRAELLEGLGVRSSSELDQKRDFERTMAHFEAIVGSDIYWQMRQFRGDARRIIHEINRFATGHKIDEEYMQRIARQALQTEQLPDLIDLPENLLLRILTALRCFIRRRLNRHEPGLTPGPDSVQGRAIAKRQSAKRNAALLKVLHEQQPETAKEYAALETLIDAETGAECPF